MEEQKKTMAELEAEAFRQLNEFLFLIIYPNPMTHIVKVIVDNGLSTISMNYEKFLGIIQRTCEHKDYNNIRLCLLEYDGPYYFDRVKQRLKQINPKNVEKPILEKTEIFKEYEKNPNFKNMSFEEKFDSLVQDYGTYINSFFDNE